MIALALTLAAASAGPRLHLGPPVPKDVRRVVTLAPSLSELVLALGTGERLVGVTRFDDDPRVAKLPRVGGYNDPEPETVLGLKPDLVLAEPAPQNRGPIEVLARLGVPVETFRSATIAEIESTIEGVAGLLGVPGKGEALRASLEDARVATQKAVRGRPRVRAMLVFGLDPLVVAGKTGFAGELLEAAGGENVAGGPQPYVRMSAETAVLARPEVIVLCGVTAPQGRPVLPGLEKVRVATLRSSALLHPGPRLPEALADLAAALRP